jgi:hypothetical protein
LLVLLLVFAVIMGALGGWLLLLPPRDEEIAYKMIAQGRGGAVAAGTGLGVLT